MTKLRCAHCGARFIPAPQVPNQAYCSKANCQKERRRQWHKSKLQSDPDYRDNQSRAQKAWTEKKIRTTGASTVKAGQIMEIACPLGKIRAPLSREIHPSRWSRQIHLTPCAKPCRT